MKVYTIAAVVSLFLVACSSTKITSRWKADVKPKTTFTNIMAVVVAGDEEHALIEKMEKHIAGDFSMMGYKGLSAFQEFGPRTLKGMNEPALIAKLNEKGIDAVMMVSLLNKTKEKYYIPSRMQRTPYAYLNDRFQRHYDIIYDRTIVPGYYAEDTRYFWECSFYDIHTGQLLYSAISESFDSGNLEALAHQYGSWMVNDMIKENVIIDKVSQAAFYK
jgi:hypothetical protein